MAKKYLEFKKCEDGHYIVISNGLGLGTIEIGGQVFKRRVVFTDNESDCEWTHECLSQLASFMKKLERKR